MGYNTNYKLTVSSAIDYLELSDAMAEKVIHDLRQENVNAEYCLTDDGETNDSGKWYDHETDLRGFSKKFPELLFTLEGHSEENEDVWRKYFVNGKSQTAKAVMTIEPFDPKALL